MGVDIENDIYVRQYRNDGNDALLGRIQWVWKMDPGIWHNSLYK